MFSPHSPHARTLLGVTWYLFVVGAAIVIAVAAAIVALWLRNRSRSDAGGDPDGVELSDGKGDRAVRWLGIYVPAFILAATFGVTIGAVIATATSSTEPPLVVDVVGRQWFWDVTYPSQNIRTANEIHIPAGTKVRLRLTSGDVVHSFWVPNLDRKMDLIPGTTNTLDLEADDTGEYRGECAEFCGIQHTRMRFLVVVDTPADFAAWVSAEQLDGAPPETHEQEQGQEILLGSACAYCHVIRGTNASGEVGPDLTHVGSRREIGAGTLPNQADELGQWLLNPQHFKPGNHMPATDLDAEEVAQLVAYLENLR